MAEPVSLHDAVARFVHDGDMVALEGFTHLIPHAAGHEIVRQGRRDLHLVRMTPDVVYDQMIGAGCAARLTDLPAHTATVRSVECPSSDAISTDRATFTRWLAENVHGPADHGGYLHNVGLAVA